MRYYTQIPMRLFRGPLAYLIERLTGVSPQDLTRSSMELALNSTSDGPRLWLRLDATLSLVPSSVQERGATDGSMRFRLAEFEFRTRSYSLAPLLNTPSSGPGLSGTASKQFTIWA